MTTAIVVRCLIGTTVLFAVAGLVNRLAGRRWSAAQRHAIWTVAMVLALALPLLLRWDPPVVNVLRPVARAVEIPRIFVEVRSNGAPSVDWAEAVRWIWMAGMAAVAAWWAAGFIRVSGMVASSREHSTFHGIAVRTCEGLRMPAVAAGPVILLPEAARQWPPERLRMVLTHEMGHVRRWDLLWRLAGTLGCCVYWFHPLAWWAAAQQRRESEMACDDRVLRNGAAADYADSLMAVAREAAGHATPSAVMAMAKPRELEGRLVAVLDQSRRRAGSAWPAALASLFLGMLAVTPLAGWQESGVEMKGSVRDVAGVIPGAKLILSAGPGGAEYKFETGPDGTYTVTGVPEGTYTLTIEKPGYQRFAGGTIKIDPGRTAASDHYLEIGSVRETVVVDGGTSGTPAPQGAPEAPKRIRISGNIQAANLLNRVVPKYPLEAKNAGVQGTVRMKAIISKEGTISSLTLLSAPSSELARAALDAVNQWTYKPTLLNGNPIEVLTMVDVNFTLAP